uniref:Si:zfos-1056e6.1 n=1 Tax=Astyanax mexicanus TaxID=7994 RepID=A0A3B1KG05_ASTMX
VWVALKRLDLNDRVTALREVHIPRGTKMTTVRQILAHSFRLDTAQLTFKKSMIGTNVSLQIRNSRGCLIPLNSCIPVNSKQPYVLEVAKYFQHSARPRSTAIHKSLKSRLQGIVRRIERLEELLPQIKQKQHDRMIKDIELLTRSIFFIKECRWQSHAAGKECLNEHHSG